MQDKIVTISSKFQSLNKGFSSRDMYIFIKNNMNGIILNSGTGNGLRGLRKAKGC